MSKPRIYGTVAVLFGMLVVTASRLLNLVAAFPGRNTLMDVLKDLGIAVFIFGMFNIMVDMPEWKTYFEERIKEIIIQQDYVDGLDKSVLMTLETNVLKAQLGSASLDQGGSLHHFVRDNIQKFLALPYRENAHAEVIYNSSEPGALLVTDKVSYTCRAMDGKIARDVQWVADTNSFREMRSIKLSVKYPQGHAKEGTTETVLVKQRSRVLKTRLNEEQAVDGLRLCWEAIYVIDEHKVQYWELTYPVKGVEVTLRYPENYQAEFVSFVPTDHGASKTQERGYLRYWYPEWTLKNCGFAWQLRESG